MSRGGGKPVPRDSLQCNEQTKERYPDTTNKKGIVQGGFLGKYSVYDAISTYLELSMMEGRGFRTAKRCIKMKKYKFYSDVENDSL